jgi:lysophospholipase L1-like esterase
MKAGAPLLHRAAGEERNQFLTLGASGFTHHDCLDCETKQRFPSPLVGEGGRRRRSDEGSRWLLGLAWTTPTTAAGATPHPTRFAGHLLPQGEKENVVCVPPKPSIDKLPWSRVNLLAHCRRGTAQRWRGPAAALALGLILIQPAAAHADPAQPIVNPAALSSFFGALNDLSAGRRHKPVHILQIGDSHTAGDQISGGLRARFQARYGAAGRGVLPVGRPYAGYSPHQVDVATSGDWRLEASFAPGNARPGPGGYPTHASGGAFGLSGWRMTSDGAASMTVAADPEAVFDQATVCGLDQPGAGVATITAGGVATPVDLSAGAPGPACRTVDLPAPAANLKITTTGGPVTLYSVETARERAGVIVSNLGVVGTQLSDFAGRDEAVLKAELAAYAPDLILLAFGDNEGFNPNLDPAAYEALVDAQIARLKRLAPGAAILVVGPPDAATIRPDIPEDGIHNQGFSCAALTPAELADYRDRVARRDPALARWYAPPNLAVARAAERRAAAASGAAFWDWSARMGGDCSAHAWRMTDPARMRGDHVHFTSEGGDAIAALLFSDLTAAGAAQNPTEGSH